VAASTLDIFNRHADKVVMANIAQTVNVLQAMVLTEGDKMLVTPTGHVYEMYAPHQGGSAVRALIDTDQVPYSKGEKEGSLPMIAGSASLKGKTLFLTLTNCHAAQVSETMVNLLGGAQAAGAVGRVLTGEIHAHNTFEQPETIQPLPFAAMIEGGSFSVTLPPASVVSLEIDLA
jgi:alpha-N-arabinofuranosidase